MLGDQFLIGAVLCDPAAPQNQNSVAGLDRRESVRDHKSRALIGIQRLGHLLLGDIVQRRRSFVKNQDLRLGRDGPCDQHSLLLSAGNAALSFRDDRLHPHGHFANILRKAGCLRRLPRVLQRQPRRGNRNILKYAAHHELSVLHDDADMPSEGAQIQTANVLAVIVDSAFSGFFKSQKNPDQRGLAASGLSDDRNVLSRLDLDTQIVQYIRHAVRIPKAHMAHFNAAAEPCHRLLAACCLRFLVQDRFHHLKGGTNARHHERNTRHLHKRAGDIPVCRCKRHVVLIGDAAADRCAVHDHDADQVDGCRNHTVHLDDHRRIIQKLRFPGVETTPAGERTLLGARQLNLLNAGDHGVIHTIFLGCQLHGGSCHLRVDQRRHDREDNRRQRNTQRRNDQRGRVVENLSDIDHRKQRRQSCRKDGRRQLLTQVRNRLGPGIQFTGAELSKERGRHG